MLKLFCLIVAVSVCLPSPVSAQLSKQTKEKLKAANKAKKAANSKEAKKAAEDLAAAQEKHRELLAKVQVRIATDKKNWQNWEATQMALEPENRPYEIKGDRLGMTLDMFQAKYFRMIPGHVEIAPFRSDLNPQHFEDWLTKAGVVVASTHWDFEEDKPTLATVETETYMFKFIDKQLHRIIIKFDQDDYYKIKSALVKKFGEPFSTKIDSYQNGFGAKFEGEVSLWQNKVSQMYLEERHEKVDVSFLTLSHIELDKLATERAEGKLVGDL